MAGELDPALWAEMMRSDAPPTTRWSDMMQAVAGGPTKRTNADGAPEYKATIGGLTVLVNKVGGGTLGRAYAGTWIVWVTNGSVWVVDGEELRTGTPKTHAEAAVIAADMIDTAELEG